MQSDNFELYHNGNNIGIITITKNISDLNIIIDTIDNWFLDCS